MPDNPYATLQALIVDDFESFRITLSKMLQELGVGTVDSAPSSSEALRQCASKVYDIILCDQNLGKGKTGQQVLEVLRHQPNLNSDSLFVLVSAESNKSIIMAAYDYEPDAYLTKPITGQTLGQRLERLFKQRLALTPVYKAMKEKKFDDVISLCETQIKAGSRYANIYQKFLGNALLQTGNFDRAEQLYRAILEVRQLDWAMLGMAHVKKRQGDSLSAQHWLEEIIQFNPFCLKAYDLLSTILAERNDSQEQQKILQQVVDISPLSILRQQKLADVSFKNNDLLNAATSYRKAVRLGEHSCHDDIKFHENFVQSSIQLSKLDRNLAAPFIRESLKIASDIPTRFEKNSSNKVKSYLLESQLLAVSGEERRGSDALANAQKIIDADPYDVSLETKIELVRSLRALGNKEESARIIGDLLSEYGGHEDQLQKIDCLLDEPSSAKNKALVAQINKNGIAFYDAKDFLRAVECFTNALQDFPQHVGLRLNLLQALIELSKQEPEKIQHVNAIRQTLAHIKNIIPTNHAQFQRFCQLEDTLRNLLRQI